jgi:hypothetical protein
MSEVSGSIINSRRAPIFWQHTEAVRNPKVAAVERFQAKLFALPLERMAAKLDRLAADPLD